MPSYQDMLTAVGALLPPAQLTANKNNGKQTHKALKIDEFIKIYKNTRYLLNNLNANQIDSAIAIICAKIFNIDLSISLQATETEENWSQFQIQYTSPQRLAETDKACQKLLDACDKIGYYHSKPFNTLSNVQFCPDPDYQPQGDYGFTANQLDDKTATLSISGGTNADSAFYAVLITRLNGLSIAEHLIGNNPDSQQIQAFFTAVLNDSVFTPLQHKLKHALNKTAASIDQLHIMDKQVLLPVFDGEQDYIAITPIINPVVFAASAKECFYVKEQISNFQAVALGGSNPSNAGTALGEVAGQNPRYRMSFPQPSQHNISRFFYSLHKTGCYIWDKATQQKIKAKLKVHDHLDVLSNQERKQHLLDIVTLAIDTMLEQVMAIQQYYQSIDTAAQQKLIQNSKTDYHPVLFNIHPDEDHEMDKEAQYEPFYQALKQSFIRYIYKEENNIFEPLASTIRTEFKRRITQGGGL